jgi:hypothetical protein
MSLYSFDITIKDDTGKVRWVVGGSEETLAKANAAIRKNEAYYLHIGYTEARIHSRLWVVCEDCRGAGWRAHKRNKLRYIDCKRCDTSGRVGAFIPIDWTPASDHEYKQLARIIVTGREDVYGGGI